MTRVEGENDAITWKIAPQNFGPKDAEVLNGLLLYPQIWRNSALLIHSATPKLSLEPTDSILY